MNANGKRTVGVRASSSGPPISKAVSTSKNSVSKIKGGSIQPKLYGNYSNKSQRVQQHAMNLDDAQYS